nr:MAG TPA: hypothetical protein [Caudoviricetes sp.]
MSPAFGGLGKCRSFAPRQEKRPIRFYWCC